MKNSYLVSILLALLGRVAIAQVPTRSIANQERLAARLAVSAQDTPPVLRLKAPDVTALLKEDQRKTRRGALPHFGKPTPLALNLLAAGRWEPAAGGRRWQLALTSPGATSLNFFFDKFYLPPGAELYLYNADHSMAIGPIDSTQNTVASVFATDLLKGETVTFELFEPATFQGKSVLHADQVVHGYQDLPGQPYAGYGQSAPCNVDINCSAGRDWQTESNAVALILLPNGQYSTGTLLNDNCKSLTSNFLTAYHSVNGMDANRMVFRFQYKSPTCAGAEPTNYISFSGAQIVASYQPTDFALLRLNQRPPTGSPIAYVGWNRAVTPATSAASLHHAAGDVMKISLAPSGVQPFLSNYWHADFAVGTTQPGSSGAALFDQNHLVVGQLYGDATNDTRDYCVKHDGDYGRFDLSWTGGGTPQTRLSDWLTTDPSVTQVPTVINPSLIGPDQVCSQTALFQSNTTLVWAATPAGLFTNSSSYGSQLFTAGAAGAAGQGTVTGTLPGACVPSVTKTVRVGTEPSGYFYGGGVSSGQTLQTVQFVTGGQISLFLNEAANFTFSSSPAIPLNSYSGRSTSFYLPPGQGVQINVSAPGSPCALATSFVFAPRSVYYYRSAPNPVSDELLVTATDPDQPAGASARLLTATTTDSLAFETTLYDSYGRPVKTQRSARGQAVLNVRDLPNGLYHLRTGHGKDVATEHIQVAH
ncbi:hypothetical protein A0257_11455 [Hymenobacter psoromatis]|nr:hypothetical protein A0257_11455 [Hymenobacter psoromatis]